MSGSPSKVNAAVKGAIGNVKEFAGNVLFNEDLQRAGQDDKADAEAEHKARQAIEKGESVKDSVKGNVQDAVGSLVGSSDMQRDGKANKASAEIKDKESKV